MNGAAVSSTGGFGGVPSTWSIVGQRDFNGDGMADLLWHDTSGNTAIWFMNGAAVSSAVSVGNIPTIWSVAGTGDFNGDGIGDILWRDSSGNLAMWLMNGATISSSAGLGNVPTNWTVVGTGDFNGDGKTDILWQDNLGNTAIWFMNGTTVASTGAVGNVPTNWSVVGTGDFNGDGKSRHRLARHRRRHCDLADERRDGVVGRRNRQRPDHMVDRLVGDYNGDGMSDLLWRDNLRQHRDVVHERHHDRHRPPASATFRRTGRCNRSMRSRGKRYTVSGALPSPGGCTAARQPGPDLIGSLPLHPRQALPFRLRFRVARSH